MSQLTSRCPFTNATIGPKPKNRGFAPSRHCFKSALQIFGDLFFQTKLFLGLFLTPDLVNIFSFLYWSFETYLFIIKESCKHSTISRNRLFLTKRKKNPILESFLLLKDLAPLFKINQYSLSLPKELLLFFFLREQEVQDSKVYLSVRQQMKKA